MKAIILDDDAGFVVWQRCILMKSKTIFEEGNNHLEEVKGYREEGKNVADNGKIAMTITVMTVFENDFCLFLALCDEFFDTIYGADYVPA